MSEVVRYRGFCLPGGFGSKNSGLSFCMELSLCPAPGNTFFLCNSQVAAQGLMWPSAAKAEFWPGGFSGGGHRNGQGRDGEET